MSATDDFYRNQAKACAESAARAQLDNQREIFLSAQRAWDALANRTADFQATRAASAAKDVETA
jgi:hypothetical protein